jgi:hypothetical protein
VDRRSALLGTSLLLTNRVIPAMFLLLLFGGAYGIVSDPTLLQALRGVEIEPRLPDFALAKLTGNDVRSGPYFWPCRRSPSRSACRHRHHGREQSPVSKSSGQRGEDCHVGRA